MRPKPSSDGGEGPPRRQPPPRGPPGARKNGRQSRNGEEIEQALVQARWAGDREKALRQRALDRYAERVRQVEELDGRRTLPEPAAPGEKPLRRVEPCGGRSEPPQARVHSGQAGGAGLGERSASSSTAGTGAAARRRGPRRQALTAGAKSRDRFEAAER